MIQIHTELPLERGSDVMLHKTATPESFPVVYSMDLASIPQRVCSNNLIPPPLCSSWKRREGGTENKASRTKAEAAIKQQRWCLCKNARLSHCPSECLLLPVSYPGSFFFVVRSVWRSCSHFPPPRAGLHRKAGWLAGGTGKETASVKRQMEDSMCLRRRNAHKCAILRMFRANMLLKLRLRWGTQAMEGAFAGL